MVLLNTSIVTESLGKALTTLSLWISFAGSTSCSTSEHWLARLGGSNKRVNLVTRSSATYPSLSKMSDLPSLTSPRLVHEKGAYSPLSNFYTHTCTHGPLSTESVTFSQVPGICLAIG